MSAMSLKKKRKQGGRKGEPLCEMEGRFEGDQGVSLETTGAVTTGNLIYLMSSWLHFPPTSWIVENTKKNIALSPPCSLSSSSFLFLFFSCGAQAYCRPTGGGKNTA